MSKVGIAIVGCGTISQLNVPGYLEHPNCEIVALCDVNEDRAIAKAKEWKINPRIYTDYDSVLADEAVDAVELLSPTHLHSSQIISGLNAGKHVSCQKPIATSMDEAKEIRKAVENNEKIFRVTENFLYYPPITKAKELIEDDAIGTPSLVRIRTIRGFGMETKIRPEKDAYVWRRDPSKNPGGMLYDDGWHKYATAISWVGGVEKVTSMVTRTDDFLADTPSAAVMKVKDKDCLITIDYSSANEMPIKGKYYSADEFFEIIGPKGTIWVTRCTGELLDMPPVILVKGDETISYSVPADWIEGFKGAARAFIDAITENKSLDMDIDFSSQVLEVALAMYESSDKEATVYIKESY